MARSFNKVILVGNLTRDVELRHTNSSTAVTDVGLAVNDRRKTPQGEWVDEVTYVDVTLWGRQAEVARATEGPRRAEVSLPRAAAQAGA